jgi:hypothetical protein
VWAAGCLSRRARGEARTPGANVRTSCLRKSCGDGQASSGLRREAAAAQGEMGTYDLPMAAAGALDGRDLKRKQAEVGRGSGVGAEEDGVCR